MLSLLLLVLFCVVEVLILHDFVLDLIKVLTYFEHILYPFSTVSIVDFEQVDVSCDSILFKFWLETKFVSYNVLMEVVLDEIISNLFNPGVLQQFFPCRQIGTSC